MQLLLSESQRLADLLSVMLDFARVDAGRIVLSPDLFDPELLCVEAFEVFSVFAGPYSSLQTR